MITTGAILGLISVIALLIFVIYSAILVYHWVRYGWGYPLIWVGGIMYGVGSVLILAVLFAAAAAI